METSAEILAVNRARGHIGVAVAEGRGTTRRARVHEAGSLRVRFPRTEVQQLEAVVVNTAGGVAGGDSLAIDVSVGAGARLVVTTAAAEKVYRSLGADALIGVTLSVGAGGSLAWVPQESILFNGARLARTIEVDLAGDAEIVLAEAVIFGRTGMGEAVEDGRLLDRWRVRRCGRLVYAETVKLDGPIAEMMARPAATRGGVAVATVLMAPGNDAMVQSVRALSNDYRGEVGVSTWNGIAAVRLCGTDGAALRHDLMQVLGAVRGNMLPRLWFN
jgi:urease accessory protein